MIRVCHVIAVFWQERGVRGVPGLPMASLMLFFCDGLFIDSQITSGVSASSYTMSEPEMQDILSDLPRLSSLETVIIGRPGLHP